MTEEERGSLRMTEEEERGSLRMTEEEERGSLRMTEEEERGSLRMTITRFVIFESGRKKIFSSLSFLRVEGKISFLPRHF